MSSSLVRKALELVECEPSKCTEPARKSKISARRRKDKPIKKSIPSYSSRVLGDVKSSAALQVELSRQWSRSDVDKTSENLKKLVAISSSKSVDFVKAQKILDHTVKNKKIVDSAQTNQSVFSEEDFRKFEEEYFVS